MGSISLDEILKITGGRVANPEAVAGRPVLADRLSELSAARPGSIAYFFSKDFVPEIPNARPSILITCKPFVDGLAKSGLPVWKESAVVTCDDPYLAMARISACFSDETESWTGVHPTAVVDTSAVIGKRTSIGPHCVVGKNVKIGDDCKIFPRVTLYPGTEVGNRVRIHAGAVVGADGFGYAQARGADGEVTGHVKIWHIGKVILGDDVEIGANCTLDRGTIGNTVIESGAKLDNDVHVGHNAHIGRGAVLCGGAALAGGAKIGRFAFIGGLSGVANRVEVGDGARVGALTLVTRDVPAGGTAVGNPNRSHDEQFRAHAILNKVAKKKGKDHESK